MSLALWRSVLVCRIGGLRPEDVAPLRERVRQAVRYGSPAEVAYTSSNWGHVAASGMTDGR